jgi:outer membrane lipoprotein-sorting protein
MNPIRSACLWLCLAAAFHSEAQADSPSTHIALDEAVKQLQGNLGATQNLVVRFQQIKTIEGFDEAFISEGIIVLEKPDQIRFEITAPYQSCIICSGSAVARFEHTEKGWESLPAEGSRAISFMLHQIMNWTLGNFQTNDSVFELSFESDPEAPRFILKAKPERLRQYIRELHIECDPALTRFQSITLIESGLDTTRLVFGSEQRNVTLPQGYFHQQLYQPISEALLTGQ